MGQTLNIPDLKRNISNLTFKPKWLIYPSPEITIEVVRYCKQSIHDLQKRESSIVQRVNLFDEGVDPNFFFLQQLIGRLCIYTPDVIKSILQEKYNDNMTSLFTTISSDKEVILKIYQLLIHKMLTSFDDLDCFSESYHNDIKSLCSSHASLYLKTFGLTLGAFGDLVTCIIQSLQISLGYSFIGEYSYSWKVLFSNIFEEMNILIHSHKNELGHTRVVHSIKEKMLAKGFLYIQWSDQMIGSGNEIIDSEHEFIIDLFNIFNYIRNNYNDHTLYEDFLIGINFHIAIHFKEEELLFNSSDYHDKKRHSQFHRKCINELTSIKKDLDAGVTDSKERLFIVISEIISHTQIMDHAAFVHFNVDHQSYSNPPFQPEDVFMANKPVKRNFQHRYQQSEHSTDTLI